MYIRKPYPNELYHHGIKGQKWGTRRYQNPDGTLTPAGEKRYHKRLVKKSIIVGEQAYIADKRANRIQNKASRASSRATKNPTDKKLKKAAELESANLEAKNEAKRWEDVFNASIKDARENAKRVTSKYGDIKLKTVPTNIEDAGRKYAKRLFGYTYLGGALTGLTIRGLDIETAERLRDQYERRMQP